MIPVNIFTKVYFYNSKRYDDKTRFKVLDNPPVIPAAGDVVSIGGNTYDVIQRYLEFLPDKINVHLMFNEVYNPTNT